MLSVLGYRLDGISTLRHRYVLFTIWAIPCISGLSSLYLWTNKNELHLSFSREMSDKRRIEGVEWCWMVLNGVVTEESCASHRLPKHLMKRSWKKCSQTQDFSIPYCKGSLIWLATFWEENGISRSVLLGSVYEPHRRGRPKTLFIEVVIKVCGGVCRRWRWQEIRTDGGSLWRRPRRIGHVPTVVDDDERDVEYIYWMYLPCTNHLLHFFACCLSSANALVFFWYVCLLTISHSFLSKCKNYVNEANSLMLRLLRSVIQQLIWW